MSGADAGSAAAERARSLRLRRSFLLSTDVRIWKRGRCLLSASPARDLLAVSDERCATEDGLALLAEVAREWIEGALDAVCSSDRVASVLRDRVRSAQKLTCEERLARSK